MQPLGISVLLSARNASASVIPSLASARRALGPDDEIVAVNDGSTDDTWARMCEALAGCRHQLLQTAGVGLTAALRLGSEAARGELIARLDAGDAMTPDRLELQREAFMASPRLVACGGNARFVSDQGNVLRRTWFATTDWGMRVSLLAHLNPMVHSTLCVRRSAFDEVGGYRAFFTYAQDFDLLLRLSRVGTMRNISSVICDCLVSPGGISATRGLEQFTFACIALREHRLATLGVSPGALSFRPVDPWKRMRLATMRSLGGRAAAARGRGHPVRAQFLEAVARSCFPVTASIGITVRAAELVARVVSSYMALPRRA